MNNRRTSSFFAAVSLFLALFVCLAGCGKTDILYQTEAGSESASFEEEAEASAEADMPAEEEVPARIWVYVCGAVHHPGVYELPEGSRVFEALAAAGGLTEDAEERSLNQASLLSDGEQITVYTREEIEGQGGIPGPAAAEAAGASSGKVNLNTAGKEELMTLSGIGESRAGAIIRYREQNGPFTSIEEIMQIDGIKEKSFEKIKEHIEV